MISYFVFVCREIGSINEYFCGYIIKSHIIDKSMTNMIKKNTRKTEKQTDIVILFVYSGTVL